ncbi:MAG: HAMP domain-containing protein [Candidatus Omnitrophica bacterium]|nr:HAMP domain-containing protein [Candidatus Omnitrophota bacterium]
MRLNSIKFKISILYVAILGIILVLYSGILFASLHYTLYDELDNELQKKATEIENIIKMYAQAAGDEKQPLIDIMDALIHFKEELSNESKLKEIENLWFQKVDKYDLKEDYINFSNYKGESIVRSSNVSQDVVSVFAKDISKARNKEIYFKNANLQKQKLRVVNTHFSYGGQEEYMLQIGTSLKPLMHILQNRLFHIAVSIPVVLLLASFIGRILVARILKPVIELTRTAQHITHQNLEARVKTEHIDEEMQYLVEAFNDMISRLENSFNYIAEFSSHVAHELKTPLAIIRGESEVALRRERPAEEYKKIIENNLEEIKRMLKTIENMLLLARLDYQLELFHFEKIELNEFIQEIYDQSRILASEKNIATALFVSQKPLFINGDRLHLRRLFFNIINNALKFTPSGGQLDIVIREEDTKAVVSVSDTGIGIAEEDLPRIFNRFFHKDRTGQDRQGTGLGLHIAQLIAGIHHGKITVESRPAGGSRFTATLPIQ